MDTNQASTANSRQQGSNICRFSNRAQIKEEAGAWLVKLDQGQLRPEQTAILKAWMQRSDFHRSYLEKLAQNWDAMAVMQQLAALFPIDGMQPDIGGRMRVWVQRLGHQIRDAAWQWSSASAAVLTAVLLLTTQTQQFTTGIGEQASYQLEDGSTVSLNTNSKLEIDFNRDRRVVRLLRGEANFNVAKNPQRPFVVYAGDGMVWAVGTAFNVRYIHDPQRPTQPTIDVTVTEGTVKVYATLTANSPLPSLSDSSQPAITTESQRAYQVPAQPEPEKEALVHAGKTVRFSQVITAIEPAAPPILESKLAWQRGALIFKGETLEQAIAEIARYTDKKLIIADPGISQIKVGGHYKTDDISALLASISQTLDLDLAQQSDQIVLRAKAVNATSQHNRQQHNP